MVSDPSVEGSFHDRTFSFALSFCPLISLANAQSLT